MLKLVLSECAKLGIGRVLITCVQGNEGSKRTILHNGGVFESTVFDPEDDCWLERYWIDLSRWGFPVCRCGHRNVFCAVFLCFGALLRALTQQRNLFCLPRQERFLVVSKKWIWYNHLNKSGFIYPILWKSLISCVSRRSAAIKLSVFPCFYPYKPGRGHLQYFQASPFESEIDSLHKALPCTRVFRK